MARLFDLAEAQARGAAFIYAPQEASDPLENLGSVSLPNGERKGDTVLTVPGLAKGRAASTHDGAGDYIDTLWPTRTNRCVDPIAPSSAAYSGGNPYWAVTNGVATKVGADVAGFTYDGAADEYALQIVKGASGQILVQGQGTKAQEEKHPVTAGTTYTLSNYVRHNAPAQRECRVTLLWWKADATTLISTTTQSTACPVGQEARASLTAVAPPEAAFVRLRIEPTLGGGLEGEVYAVTRVLFEETAEVKAYFPTPGQLAPWSPSNPEGGLAGWSATANNSASDIGPWARGTIRTLVSAARRDSQTTTDALAGGSGPVTADAPLWWFDDFNDQVRWLANGGGSTEIFAGAGLEAEKQGILSLTFDDPGNTVTLTKDLAVVGESEITDTFKGAASGRLLIGARLSGSTPYHGLLLPFLVFTRPLTLGDLEAIFPPHRLTVNERPPMRQYVLATTPSSNIHRWSEDEPGADKILQNLDDEDTVPGGYKQATGALPRKPGIDYSDMAVGTHLEIRGAGHQLISEYRLERAARNSGEYLTMDPAAFGYQGHLDDDPSAQGLPIDADMSQWGEVSAARKIAWSAAKLNQNGQVTLLPAGDPLGSGYPTLSHAFATLNTSAANPDVAESWLDTNGIEVGRVLVAKYNEAKGGGGGSWITALFASDDDIATTSELLKNWNGTDSVAVETFNVEEGMRFLLLQTYFAALATGDGEWEHQWQGIVVFDRSGIPTQGEWPNIGVLASDVIAYAVGRWAPLLNFTTSGPAPTIRPTVFPIPHLPFREPVGVSEWVKGANRFELDEWGVWGGKTFHLCPRGTRTGRKRWRARVRPTQLKETGESMDRVYNGAVVEYQDVDGTTKVIGPPGSGLRLVDERLLDTDPLNPANRIPGLKRWAKVVLKSQSTPEGAVRTAQRFLELQKELDGSGQAILDGYIEDEYGREWPYYCAHAGDLIDFVDSSIPGDRYVVAAGRKRAERQAEVTLDAPKEAMEALLEQLDIVLVPLGFGSA